MILRTATWTWVQIFASCSSTVLCLTVAGPDPNSSLQTSPDGMCGQGFTCADSNFGQCCSTHYYCGTGDAYCGQGCHPDFGYCSDAGAATSATALPATASCAAVKTKTETARTTLTFRSTETSTSVVTSTFYAYVISSTSIATVQATETVTRTVSVTSTAHATATKTAYVTETYDVLLSSTSVILATSTVYVTAAVSVPVPVPDRTSAAPVPAKTFSGSPSDCMYLRPATQVEIHTRCERSGALLNKSHILGKKWYLIRGGDTCQHAAAVSGLSLQRL